MMYSEVPRQAACREITGEPGLWKYDDLTIQADPDAHRATVAIALDRLHPGARILDVGAGTGALARQLQDRGFDVECTSWNGRCGAGVVTYALDLDRPFTLEQVGGRTFRMLSLIEVLEHVENPAALLRCCASVLDPDGLLVASTPNVGGLPARLQWLRRGCPQTFSVGEIQGNRHISMLWPQGTEYLAAQAGLRIVERRALLGMRRFPVRRWIYAAAARLLHTTAGVTLLYVLERDPQGARRLGAGDVY